MSWSRWFRYNTDKLVGLDAFFQDRVQPGLPQKSSSHSHRASSRCQGPDSCVTVSTVFRVRPLETTSFSRCQSAAPGKPLKRLTILYPASTPVRMEMKTFRTKACNLTCTENSHSLLLIRTLLTLTKHACLTSDLLDPHIQTFSTEFKK